MLHALVVGVDAEGEPVGEFSGVSGFKGVGGFVFEFFGRGQEGEHGGQQAGNGGETGQACLADHQAGVPEAAAGTDADGVVVPVVEGVDEGRACGPVGVCSAVAVETGLGFEGEAVGERPPVHGEEAGPVFVKGVVAEDDLADGLVVA